MQTKSTGEGIQNLITEKELLDLFGVSKRVLSDLRHKRGLPFLAVSRYTRLYLESSLMEWLKDSETVLNSTEMPF